MKGRYIKIKMVNLKKLEILYNEDWEQFCIFITNDNDEDVRIVYSGDIDVAVDEVCIFLDSLND